MQKVNDSKFRNYIRSISGIALHTILCFAASMFGSTAHAAPITVNFSGTIDSQFGDSWVEVGFNIGDTFTGQYTFESTTLGNQSVTNFGGVPPERMPYPGAILSFTATSNGNTLTSSGDQQNGILIDDNLYGKDNYFVVLSSNLGTELYIELRSTNTNLFASQDLPLSLPDISNFDNSAFFRVRTVGGTGGLAWAQGNLDSIQLASVPLPATLWLFLTGLGLIGVRMQKRVIQPNKAN